MTQPTLDRSLGLRSVVLFGLAYMAPMIVLGTFGAVAEETGGAVPSAYVLALIAMLFTAYIYGRLAATYPVAGSAYRALPPAAELRQAGRGHRLGARAAIGVIIDLYLLFNLSGLAKLLGLCWLALGFLYLLVLTRGFRRPPPELDTLAAEQEVDERADA